MIYRFFSRILCPVVYRIGKRDFKTVSMSANLGSCNKTQTSELEIDDSSADPEQQEHPSEGSCGASFDSSQMHENSINAAADASGDQLQLSKRALKRVRLHYITLEIV